MYIFAVMSVCVFLIVGQLAGPIGTKLGTQIHLDHASVLGESREGDHLSGKPGNVREFDGCQGF